MNLREQLLNSPKPPHQFHDADSIEWLSLNRPEFLPKIYKLKQSFVEIVERKKPWERCNNDWFTNKLIRDGIHGFRHVCRVAIYSISLALQARPEISEQEIEALIFAALLHDCRRVNDNADFRHGVRAKEWLGKNNHILPKKLQPLYKAIHFAIAVHNDQYDQIIRKVNYQKFKFFVDILKTADALDRYRFPREDWWLKNEFVVLIPNQQNMAFAYDLVLGCERLFLQTKDNQGSVERAWKKLNQDNYANR
ncbi:MAG: hypothetical protein A3A98_01220 [Candidatus Staskawiczbacteria bacterium RIFCSPLOWO2_01_FULL_40_39]|uniref:HD/PDEase domain-containing protein n=1 Tax=Candidatus Staskawiczbacteria bacterium RIFCSPHIGHO2_01_FULL_39_25 TaxID=1802202 RepID=A0A1G2HNM9_9BACT|nr:MAG: hypothetical protein A2730_01220 [Candidatus Staskawiczbacteria bacterium RIFCSPHIGHO2_01_FULL_39_25]OGZ73348.1 MAG: hypothetical protein A3A98_01220 [Candidatus Staskawiczbacteria bacterium RIFCSPLOWO2_01_FULL_40_39]OGZ76842.1 MAG: hypothetical protein A3I87_01855 [Candidatus Staskawiczbacteria bacterium RIFCSPLOWO2_02_FULL_39_8]